MEIKLNDRRFFISDLGESPLVLMSYLDSFELYDNELKIGLVLFPKQESLLKINIKSFDRNYISKLKHELKVSCLSEAIIFLVSNNLIKFNHVIINSVGLDWNGVNSLINFIKKQKNENKKFPKINLIVPKKALKIYGEAIELNILEIDSKETKFNFKLNKSFDPNKL